MNNQSDNININNDYNLNEEIDCVVLDIEYYWKKIDYYKRLIKICEDNKPFFFQRKKLLNYYNELSEYKEILKQASLKLDEVIESMQEGVK